MRVLRLFPLLLALVTASAADAASARFSRLSVEEGLSQSSVETIAEDRFGFLWFGTQEGLNRFDGYEFTVYQPGSQPGRLRDGLIRAIEPDRRGDLWIGTLSGVQHLDVATGRFSEPVTLAGSGVRLNGLRVMADGRVWFVSRGGELWTRAPSPAAPAQPVAREVFGSGVTAIATAGESNLWVAARGHLYALEVNERAGALSVKAAAVLRDIGTIRLIHPENGALWIARQDAPLLAFDPRSGRRTEHEGLPQLILTIVPAGEGRLWIGGRDAGLTRFDPATGEILTYRHEPGNEDSLAENDVAVVMQDRGGSLWVGAWNGGLSRLDLYSQAFRTLRSTPGDPDSLPDNDVTRMAEGPDGRLWTITRNDVLAAGDPKSGSFIRVPFEGDLTAIAFAGANLFAGTAAGLVELDPSSGRVTPPRAPIRAAGLDRRRIELLAGADETLWIISEDILYRLTNDDSGPLPQVPLPRADEATSIHAESPERLWIAYEKGSLLRAELVNGRLVLQHYRDSRLAARGRLAAIAEHEGTVWLGAALAIGRLTPADGHVEWFDLDSGMPSRSVASILADDSGVLWLAMNQGILRFDPRSRQTAHFGGTQGAQAWGYVDSGAARGTSGLFYFAGKGLTVFDPRQVVTNPRRPRVVFTALEILHRPVLPSWIDAGSPLATEIHAARDLTLGPDAAVFSVEMAALGAGDPEGVRFLHRLEGFDAGWIETGAERRVATYTRLAPGRYVLRARARTRAGVWSDGEATLHIRILPPWWRTPAAIVLWIAIALLAILAVIRETRRTTRVRIALAEQEVLRRASVTDPLTGLYNRRFLAAWMKHEVPRTLRTHRQPRSPAEPESLLFVMADLDNLKEINDAHGHDAGDRAIRAIAGLLESHARGDDLVVRWGGDEFLLVVRSADRFEAGRVVERLRTAAEQLGSGSGETPRLTISLGFASFPFVQHEPEALTWEQTLQIADRALLQSKRRGRNAWTGFLEAPATSAGAVLHHLESAADHSPWPMIRIVQGPEQPAKRDQPAEEVAGGD